MNVEQVELLKEELLETAKQRCKETHPGMPTARVENMGENYLMNYHLTEHERLAFQRAVNNANRSED